LAFWEGVKHFSAVGHDCDWGLLCGRKEKKKRRQNSMERTSKKIEKRGGESRGTRTSENLALFESKGLIAGGGTARESRRRGFKTASWRDWGGHIWLLKAGEDPVLKKKGTPRGAWKMKGVQSR